MLLKYGWYLHDLNEAALTIRREALLNAGQIMYGYREHWTIDGLLHGDDQAQLTERMQRMKEAYSVQGGDLGLFLSDGKTPTTHAVLSAETLGGVRVMEGPSFPQGNGAEYSTFRTYRIRLEFEVAQAGTRLLAWEETLSFTGGGPRFVLLQTLNGLPQRQQVAEATPFRVEQRGRAVGLREYPLPNGPLWPGAEHLDRRRIARAAPRRVGTAGTLFTDYEVTWQYDFEDVAPLWGQPTPWRNA